MGNETLASLEDWIDVGVYAQDQLIYLQKHLISDEVSELEITVSQAPSKAGIDPLHKLMDRKPEDNMKKLSYP
ncbi:hypothetical protein JMN32_19970 [Fulvivirga sp. 29W222]|uniref:Uncharacterized protein n=1 Tax=Fulvivirga marina TaxID=2494733 RepID=A0A937FYQ1_9BACT|nr:hypothetical protein [Fulvivirga marina]MBL6448599.1 hypothetical protein [Fulvivirga marina]